MRFCNTYVPQSPRWHHKQWDFKNSCSSQWVTPSEWEFSEHQPYQLHTNLVREMLQQQALVSPQQATQPTAAGRGQKRSIPRASHIQLDSQSFSKGPSLLRFPPLPLLLSRFQLQLNFQKIWVSRKSSRERKCEGNVPVSTATHT